MEKDKTYKTRVEISLIVEIDVEACHEDNAAFRAEEIGNDLAAEMVSTIEYEGKYYVPNYGCTCVEVEEASNAEV